jgi:hypothetical protein
MVPEAEKPCAISQDKVDGFSPLLFVRGSKKGVQLAPDALKSREEADLAGKVAE